MNQIQELLNQAQPYWSELLALLSLYSEIMAALAAAGLLGLFVGWMIKRSSSKRQLATTIDSWEKRYAALEESNHADTENLEEQLQTIASEAKTLQSTNRALSDSLKKNDTSIQRSRAEAIELNRQHAETQERLQRIIQQKDREIVELGNRMHDASKRRKATGSTHIAPLIASVTNDQSQRFTDSELNHADTVAISNSEMSADSFDATIQMSATELSEKTGKKAALERSDDLDEFEDTADLSGIIEDEYEESTVALDEEALAFAKRPLTSRSKN
ncbi:MAG: hypothetical protein AB8B79_08640 [Granulosicoccus sp.]